MKPRALHRWRLSYRDAVAVQDRLRPRLRFTPLRRPPRLLAGADVAFSRATHRMHAAVVLLQLPSLEVVETAEASSLARFPYIPGLFAFRELPALLAAFGRLRRRPDVLMFDGHGIAHPRGFGLASHAGMLFERPSLGCAKSILVGEHGALPPRRGSRSPLVFQGRVVGAAVRTRAGVRPVYVSAGHLIDLDSAVDVVLATGLGYRLPEPVRLAHAATTARMRRVDPGLEPPRERRYANFRGTGPTG
jgi:deoxyribonuclease V